MGQNTGVWIDHSEAILVHLTDAKPTITRIPSDVEKQARRSSDRTDGPFEAQKVKSDDKQQRKYSAELSRFYDEVLTHLGETSTLLIFGPGEAKIEFQKHVESSRNPPQHISVETADKLTEAQFLARVREFFE